MKSRSRPNAVSKALRAKSRAESSSVLAQIIERLLANAAVA
jgi:hypothetical protein